MVDFDHARQVMIDGQLRAGGVFEPRLLARFSTVPREVFVPQARQALAYIDDVQWFGPAGSSRFMPAPATLGKLLHLADIQPTDKVLDIGASSGYGTAIIAGLAASVLGVEGDAALASVAVGNLAALGLANVAISSDLTSLKVQSFDVIILQGMVDTVPAEWLDLLRDGGRLVTLIRRGAVGTAHLFSKADGKVTERSDFNAVLPDLPGQQKEQTFIF